MGRKENAVIDELQGLGQFEPEASMSGLGEAARKGRVVAPSRRRGARSEPQTQRGRALLAPETGSRRISGSRLDLVGLRDLVRSFGTPAETKDLRSAIATIARGALGVLGSTCEAAAGVLAIGVLAAETCSRSCAGRQAKQVIRLRIAVCLTACVKHRATLPSSTAP